VPGVHVPTILFDAHMDEIGYQVTHIQQDGELVVRELGGFYGRYYLGHVMLVHLPDGRSIGAVLGLPSGWDRPGFKWPPALSTLNESADAYVGTDSRAATERLGIRVGDFLTIPKTYRPLLGSHFEVRSIDDRAGDTALIETVRALGPDFARKYPGHQVTFLWATREEVGLEGAAAYAARVAKLGREPDVVFAVDMFVSSESPLETRRYGDTPLGKGFVVRAVDLSHVDPPADVARVVALARAHHIPVQYGVTGGGNDAAVYTRYGSNAVALGWPTKYSHSARGGIGYQGRRRTQPHLHPARDAVVRRIRQVRQCAISCIRALAGFTASGDTATRRVSGLAYPCTLPLLRSN